MHTHQESGDAAGCLSGMIPQEDKAQFQRSYIIFHIVMVTFTSFDNIKVLKQHSHLLQKTKMIGLS